MKIGCMISSALAGAICMYFKCSICAPHGGIFVIPLSDHAWHFLLALVVGTVFGAFFFAILRTKREKELQKAK